MPQFRLSMVAGALALGLSAVPLSLHAQETPTPTPAPEAPADGPGQTAGGAGTEFNTGEVVGGEAGPGQDYVLATHGDWEIRCIRTEDGFDPCRIYQLLTDDEGNSVAELALVALPQGSEAVAGATVITPLETLLTAQLTMAIDGGKAKRYPFSWCSQIGCFARIGLVADELAQLKRGARAIVTIVPMMAPDKQVNLTVSLSGFTAAFDAMKAKNEETQKRAEAAQGQGGGQPQGQGN